MNFITFLTITNFFFLTFNIHQYLHECKLFSACKHYFWTYAGTCFLKQDGGESISKSPYGISGRALGECTPPTTTTTSTTFSKSFVILMLSEQSFYNTVFLCLLHWLIKLQFPDDCMQTECYLPGYDLNVENTGIIIN